MDTEPDTEPEYEYDPGEDLECARCGDPWGYHGNPPAVMDGDGPCQMTDCECEEFIVPDSPPRSWTEFQEVGFLWLVNRTTFHPRGYALAFHREDDEEGPVTGWSLQGDGDEPWSFGDAMESVEDRLFHEVQTALPTRADRQIDRLAEWIMENRPDDITEGGAVDVAIQIMSTITEESP